MLLRESLFQIYTLTENFIDKKEGGAYKLDCCAAWNGSLFYLYTVTANSIVTKGR